MQKSDRTEFVLIMTALAELHNRKLSAPLLDIYWLTLNQYSLKDIKRALSQLIVDTEIGQFMPKPADIVRMIDGSNENQALTAWHKVLYAIQHIGAYESVKFDDPLIHLVINGMGGWTTLCRTNTKELHYRYAEFKERYAAYKHQKIEYYPDHLNGLLNQSTSFQSGNNQPRFISNDFLQRLPIKSLPN